MGSMPSISRDVVAHVAELARLELSSAELDQYASQLEKIVAYVDQLKDVPDSLLPAPAALDRPMPVRDDRPRAGAGREALEHNAPEMSHEHVVVPRVVGGGS
jgi:aspartyl-tRNA(Asn)/glutamyl-tRNA(Gln) amidotransferase subunit C